MIGVSILIKRAFSMATCLLFLYSQCSFSNTEGSTTQSGAATQCSGADAKVQNQNLLYTLIHSDNSKPLEMGQPGNAYPFDSTNRDQYNLGTYIPYHLAAELTQVGSWFSHSKIKNRPRSEEPKRNNSELLQNRIAGENVVSFSNLETPRTTSQVGIDLKSFFNTNSGYRIPGKVTSRPMSLDVSALPEAFRVVPADESQSSQPLSNPETGVECMMKKVKNDDSRRLQLENPEGPWVLSPSTGIQLSKYYEENMGEKETRPYFYGFDRSHDDKRQEFVNALGELRPHQTVDGFTYFPKPSPLPKGAMKKEREAYSNALRLHNRFKDQNVVIVTRNMGVYTVQEDLSYEIVLENSDSPGLVLSCKKTVKKLVQGELPEGEQQRITEQMNEFTFEELPTEIKTAMRFPCGDIPDQPAGNAPSLQLGERGTVTGLSTTGTN